MPDSATVPTCTCPQCETRFRVTPEQLGVAGGRVRCGACLTVFDASGVLPELALQPSPANAGPELSQAQPGPRPRPAPKRPMEESPSTVGNLAAPFAGPYALAAGLLVALVLGLNYPVWSQKPPYRSLYQAICAVGPCELASRRTVASIQVDHRPPIRNAGPPATLRLAVELVNQASHRQVFPTLGVQTADADGKPLSEHRLAPKDYLPPGHPAEMGVGAATTVELRLPDPGVDAASYALAVM